MIRTLEHNRKEKRKRLCEAEGEIDTRRDDLTGEIEGQLSQQQSIEALFTVRWACKGPQDDAIFARLFREFPNVWRRQLRQFRQSALIFRGS
jgi:hypothetical protein